MSLQGRVPFSRGQVIAAPTKKKDTGSWPEIYSKKVDMKKVKRDAFQPWITKRISKLMGGEDEVIESYVVEMLAAAEVEPKAPLHPTTPPPAPPLFCVTPGTGAAWSAAHSRCIVSPGVLIRIVMCMQSMQSALEGFMQAKAATFTEVAPILVESHDSQITPDCGDRNYGGSCWKHRPMKGFQRPPLPAVCHCMRCVILSSIYRCPCLTFSLPSWSFLGPQRESLEQSQDQPPCGNES